MRATTLHAPGDVRLEHVPDPGVEGPGTGHHAAFAARVEAGTTVAVVGDGAVGLCAVLAARRLGAERVIAMSRHEPRQELARRYPGPVFDVELPLDDVAEGYRAMDERRAVKVLLRP